jgi:hypothetical protein
MQDENERRDGDSGNEQTRPQQGGEGGTTRFGMEDGDNSDVPATGFPDAGDEASERSS